MNVSFVIRNSIILMHWKIMKSTMKKRRNYLVKYVESFLNNLGIWEIIKGTLIRAIQRITSVKCVTDYFSQKECLRCMKKQHTGEKPFQCNSGEKKFVTSWRLKKHMDLHSGEKPNPCRMCEKAFNRVDHLKNHMMIHTQEKPYVCKSCGKCFTQKVNLKCHERIHGKVSNQLINE